MKKFDKIILKYLDVITEQDIKDANQPEQAPAAPPAEQNNQPTQTPPVQEKEASAGFTAITKLILTALRTKEVLRHNDIKFSDNTARNADEAFKYFEIVKRNLPKQTQAQLFNDVKGGGTFNDLDENTLIDAANLAIKALFFQGKVQDITSITQITDVDEVTPQNAKSIYKQIRNFFTVVEN